MVGIPTRIEIGPKDIENGQVVVVRRDTREKIVVAIDELTEKLSEILETIQKDMFERAKAFRDSHIHTAANMDEMVKVAREEIGLIKAMWCGDDACEEEIKAQTGGVNVQMYSRGTGADFRCVCMLRKTSEAHGILG